MILIGTLHEDLEGPSRLEHLLGRLQPKVLTIEAPVSLTIDELAEIFSARRQLFTRLVQSLNAPQFYKDLLVASCQTMGYDTLVPTAYAKRQGIEIYQTDHPALAELLRKPVDEKGYVEMHNASSAQLVKQLRSQGTNVTKLTFAVLRQAVVKLTDKAYFDSKILQTQLISNPSQDLQSLDSLMKDPQFSEEREQFITDQVLARKSDVHVAGIAHVGEEYNGTLKAIPLYQRLGGKVSQKIRLCDAHKIELARQT